MLIAGNDGVRWYGLSRRQEQGGMWGRWFCEACNNRAGLWDQEYLRWLPALQLGVAQSESNGLRGVYQAADPGAFVRSLWAWGFALATNLRAACPGVAEAVLTGEPVAPPLYRLKLAATREDQFAIIVLPHSVNVTAQPFVMSLIWPAMLFRDTTPMFDTGGWLLERAGEKSRVELVLPIVDLGEEGRELPIDRRACVGAEWAHRDPFPVESSTWYVVREVAEVTRGLAQADARMSVSLG